MLGKKKNNLSRSGVSLIFILVLLGSVGLFFLKNSAHEDSFIADYSEEKAVKKYHNQLLGISFEYPSNWYLREDVKQTKEVTYFKISLDYQDNANHGPSYVSPISFSVCAYWDYEAQVFSPCAKSIEALVSTELRAMEVGASSVSKTHIGAREVTILEGTYSNEAGPLAGSYSKKIFIPWDKGYFLELSSQGQQYNQVLEVISTSLN